MSNVTFGFEHPEDSPGFLLWQTTVIWQRRIKKILEACDISHAQFVIMALLLWIQESSPGDYPNQVTLVQLSKLDKMTVSQALKKLSIKNLICRVENTVDTRAKTVTLTHEGRMLIKKLMPLVEKEDADFFKSLASKQQTVLKNLLSKLAKN